MCGSLANNFDITNVELHIIASKTMGVCTFVCAYTQDFIQNFFFGGGGVLEWDFVCTYSK